ncbi:MAG: hypothetical protein IH899_04170 [Planctomycetes bacterium]|nr:hypothetical protein [Planctomycetota bacterium]
MHRKRMKCILSHMTKTAASLMLLAVLSSMVACKPGQFLQRNACELLNCDMLFFIDDMFPLAAQPGGGGGGGGAAEPSEEEEGGGHLH